MRRADPAATLAVAASPFGPIHLAVDERALVGLQLHTTDDAFRSSVARRLGGSVVGPGAAPADVPPDHARVLERVLAVLDAYLEGDPRALDGVPVELQGVSAWDRAVLAAVRAIPFGTVTSYGRVAARIGHRGAARAVGAAVGRNPIGLLIPCHRVIAGDGTIGGYGGDRSGSREEALELKRSLLAHEGVFLPIEGFVD